MSSAAPIDRRRLPLNSLRAFEAAARMMSFTRAADELGVTQSAISRHVLNLEEVIGARLFDRKGSSLALTGEGRSLLAEVTPALDRLQGGVNAICAADHRGTLRLALPPSFAVRMAAPIIEACRVQGGVEVEIDTPYALESLDTTTHDAAVVFSRPRVTDQVMDLLWMEELSVVCRTEQADDLRRDGLAAVLSTTPAIHVRNESGRHTAWGEILRASGLDPSPPSGIVFDTAHMALEFALQEGGLVAADPRLAARNIAEGTLAVPLPLRVASGFGYFLLLRPEDLQREAVSVFRNVLLRTFAAEVASSMRQDVHTTSVSR